MTTRNVYNALPQAHDRITNDRITNDSDDAEAQAPKGIDWASVALGSALAVAMVAGGVFLWNDFNDVRKGGVRLRRQRRANRFQAQQLDDALTEEAQTTRLDPAVIEAAALLGVEPDASARDVRAAFRARMATDGVHPDHGGDEVTARRLIEARARVLAHLNQLEMSK